MPCVAPESWQFPAQGTFAVSPVKSVEERSTPHLSLLNLLRVVSMSCSTSHLPSSQLLAAWPLPVMTSYLMPFLIWNCGTPSFLELSLLTSIACPHPQAFLSLFGCPTFLPLSGPNSSSLHFTPSHGSHDGIWGDDDSFCLSRTNYADLGPLITGDWLWGTSMLYEISSSYVSAKTSGCLWAFWSPSSLGQEVLKCQQANLHHPPLEAGGQEPWWVSTWDLGHCRYMVQLESYAMSFVATDLFYRITTS